MATETIPLDLDSALLSPSRHPLCVMAASSPSSPPPGLALLAETELLPPQTPVLSREDVDDWALVLDTELGTCEDEGLLCPEGSSGQHYVGGQGSFLTGARRRECGQGVRGRQTLQLSRVMAAEEASCRENRMGR